MDIPLSVIAWTVQMAVFHVVGVSFEVADRTQILGTFKVRRADRYSYARLLPRVLGNQIFILLPLMVLCERLGLAYVGPATMSAGAFVVSALAMSVGHDIVMYLTHRLILHNRRFRWMGHSVHHATMASRSISACYMSPIDFLLEIVLPFLVPLILIGGGGSNVAFHVLVPSAGALGGLYEHSGYDFARSKRFPSILYSSHAHGQHHLNPHVSFSDGFGSPGLCDGMFGTAWSARSRTGVILG